MMMESIVPPNGRSPAYTGGMRGRTKVKVRGARSKLSKRYPVDPKRVTYINWVYVAFMESAHVAVRK